MRTKILNPVVVGDGDVAGAMACGNEWSRRGDALAYGCASGGGGQGAMRQYRYRMQLRHGCHGRL